MDLIDWGGARVYRYEHASGGAADSFWLGTKQGIYVNSLKPNRQVAHFVVTARFPKGGVSRMTLKGTGGVIRSSRTDVSGRVAAVVMADSSSVIGNTWSGPKEWTRESFKDKREIWNYQAHYRRVIPAWTLDFPVHSAARNFTFALALNDPWKDTTIELLHGPVEFSYVAR